MVILFDQIKSHLDQVADQDNSINETLDILNADTQQVKDRIRTSIQSAIKNLHLREQLLLQHVDETSKCINHTIQSDKGKAAEIRGKLKACIEISNLPAVEDLHSYAKECYHESQLLLKQEKNYERGSLSFIAEESQLFKSIQHFGRVVNTTSQSHAEGSEKSWEFAGSEVTSYGSENFEAPKQNECHGVCVGTAFEIEDIDRHFGMTTEKPFLTLSQFCKANEVCHSIKDCLFDEPCRKARHDIEEPNLYVAKILKDMNQIGNPEDNQNDLPNNQQDQSDFQRTVSLLNEEFQNIIGSKRCDDVPSNCGDSVPTSSCSVQSLASEIDQMITGPVAKTRKTELNTTADLSLLASEINAIIGSDSADNDAGFVRVDLSEEMKKLNVNSQPNADKLLSSFPSIGLQPKKSANGIELEKQDSEKSQDDDFAFLNAITGSTTLDELNSTLLSIIDS